MALAVAIGDGDIGWKQALGPAAFAQKWHKAFGQPREQLRMNRTSRHNDGALGWSQLDLAWRSNQTRFTVVSV